jgi:hypothetical protein
MSADALFQAAVGWNLPMAVMAVVSNVSAMAVTSGHKPVALAACPPKVA